MTESRLLRDVAQSPLYTLSTTDTVARALEVSRAHGVHHFPVRKGSNLAGFVCVCDMIGAREDTSVALVMTAGATTLPDTASVRDAAEVMKRTGRGSVLVTNEDGACGIVTRADVVAWDDESAGLLSEQRCDCCGLRQHLRTLEGRTLCAFCLDSTTEAEWFSRMHA